MAVRLATLLAAAAQEPHVPDPEVGRIVDAVAAQFVAAGGRGFEGFARLLGLRQALVQFGEDRAEQALGELLRASLVVRAGDTRGAPGVLPSGRERADGRRARQVRR